MTDVEKNAKDLSASTARGIDKVFWGISKTVNNLALFLEDPSYSDNSKLRTLLEKIVAHNNEIFGCCVAFEPSNGKKGFAPYCWKKGNSIEYTELSGTYQYQYLDWYQIPKELRKAAWMEPYYDEGGGNIIMTTYSVPFYSFENGKKKFKGVVTADISLSWLQKLVASMKPIKNGYGFLISKHGTIVTHPDVSKIMNETIFSMAEETANKKLRKIGREMINGKSGFTSHRCFLFNRKCWLYYTPLESSGWSLGVVFPEKELFAPLKKLNINIALISIAGLVALLLIIIWISHKITKPLRELALAAEKIGEGQLDIKIPLGETGDEIGILGKSFSKMQKDLAEYIENLQETTAAKERIESELSIARDIQLSIIPKLFPAFPDRKEFDIYAVLESAKAVGGDLYNFFFIDEKHLYFAVGDVSGKGVPASLFMAVTQTLSRAKTDKDLSAGEIVTSINKDLCRDNEMSMFVTYFLCLLNIETGELEYCNAGHNPPFIVGRDKELKKLDTKHGMPLGVFDINDYSSDKIKLDHGDCIVLYTDGVTEAMDVDNNEFGEDRLVKILDSEKPVKNAESVTKTILKEVKVFTEGAEQSDDITILSLTFH
jgi:sigma-B regulation protein RsbU (phosphoserine phosphatase)